jgi:hypothetical protein
MNPNPHGYSVLSLAVAPPSTVNAVPGDPGSGQLLDVG